MTGYFTAYERRLPPATPPMSARREAAWHFWAALTIGLGLWYLHWRWTASLNPDALGFSMAVALAETMAYLGTLLFFYDIWKEGDTPRQAPPATRAEVGLDPHGAVSVDVFITTYDEDVDIVEPSIRDALAVSVPDGVTCAVHVLDDGDRPDMRALAGRLGAGYLRRDTNEGFKAGNIRNALFETDGDFIVICDADTRLMPTFLENTLGYFRDPNVAWVQTPHWFYDIPEGQPLARVWERKAGKAGRCAARIWGVLSGQTHVGRDPFHSDPAVFFDVIQRRRNRHGASFCCGAGSIHRREAVFECALRTYAADLGRLQRRSGVASTGPCAEHLSGDVDLQPFRFHVSEDLFTSILLHSDDAAAWRSVYHPQVESRMLSPWSMDAWATQRLKYAGGTFDILLRANPLFRRGMPWRIKLHYAATFWSYLGTLWMPVLLFAPGISMLLGVAAVEAYSITFFAHLLPVLLANEVAMSIGCKGHDKTSGSIMWLSSFPLTLRALWLVARGKRPKFPPTPKTPGRGASYRHVRANIAILAFFALAAAWGIWAHFAGSIAHSGAFMVVNLFWLGWNALGVGRIITAASWQPKNELNIRTQDQPGEAQDARNLQPV
ncbi:glycosyltransferase family 2 protein [Pseudaestuariivita atlantica]|uniref:Glycosyltransferase 2-like domain-containing protein n=1 Tax=Pseudaestuariivita atlantica TaxID=1317121 RepID=A0A0L1JPJ1_9RHOB|nr:cellulose synthase catalytic subunit [Pseudaestuariivita atlantica]KNG93651.1 hypothetical protein ATO11_10635 [Pseudaestuariivita atlantica]